jgi:hypothetical protein
VETLRGNLLTGPSTLLRAILPAIAGKIGFVFQSSGCPNYCRIHLSNSELSQFFTFQKLALFDEIGFVLIDFFFLRSKQALQLQQLF